MRFSFLIKILEKANHRSLTLTNSKKVQKIAKHPLASNLQVSKTRTFIIRIANLQDEA
jgi:hypothetical protein